MSRPRRISELELTTSPALGDLTVLASNGQSKRTTVGSFGTSVLNANFPVTSSGIQVNGPSILGNSLDNTHQLTGSISVTGSVSIDDVLALTPRATSLPTDVPAGSIMISGSGITLAPYFWNGTSWVSMI